MLKRYFFTIATALLIMFLSLAEFDSPRIPDVRIPGFDKIIHTGMYFVLMAVIIMENKLTRSKLNLLLKVSALPLAYSIILEVLQSSITIHRSGSAGDVVFNLAGILLAVLVFKIRYRKVN